MELCTQLPKDIIGIINGYLQILYEMQATRDALHVAISSLIDALEAQIPANDANDAAQRSAANMMLQRIENAHINCDNITFGDLQNDQSLLPQITSELSRWGGLLSRLHSLNTNIETSLRAARFKMPETQNEIGKLMIGVGDVIRKGIAKLAAIVGK